MGKQDKTQKLLLGCADVFAETLNVLIYDGRDIVSEAHLLPAPTESIYPQTDGENTLELQQFQDFSMYEMQNGKIRTLYTTENQSSIDHEMPLRCAGYNGMAYRKQYTGIHKGSGRKIYPVIGLVLNWSKKPWTAARSIRELLDSSVEQGAEPYIDRNEIHVFDMYFLEQSVREKFHGDMRVILDYLADPESLRHSRQPLRNPEEVLRMLTALSGDKRYLKYITCNETKGGKTNMCEVLDNAIKEGLTKGYCVLISTCKDFKLDYAATAAKLKEKYDLSDAEVEENMKLYW